MTEILDFFSTNKDAFVALGVFVSAITAIITSLLTLRVSRQLSRESIELQKDLKNRETSDSFRLCLVEAIAKFYRNTSLETGSILVSAEGRGAALAAIAEVRILTLDYEPESGELSSLLMDCFIAPDHRKERQSSDVAQLAKLIIEKKRTKENRV